MKPHRGKALIAVNIFAYVICTIRDANVFQSEANSGIICNAQVTIFLFPQTQLIQGKYD